MQRELAAATVHFLHTFLLFAFLLCGGAHGLQFKHRFFAYCYRLAFLCGWKTVFQNGRRLKALTRNVALHNGDSQ